MRKQALFNVSLLTLILSLLIIAANISAETIIGKVENVVDGNTIIVRVESESLTIRLYGIFCPDATQPYGKRAKEVINDLVRGEQVELMTEYEDRYGRIFANVYVSRINLSEALIERGYAMVCPEYCKKSFCSEWYDLERSARKQKLGMWSEPIFNR
jgi:endonuclease YncB( thermonuclease family)